MMQFEMHFSKGKCGQRMFVELIKEKILQVFHAFAGSPGACVYLESIFCIASVFCLRSIVAALVEMHRSRSKIKKLYNRYSFWQKLAMKPAWHECLHAKRFCRVLIVCHHVRLSLFLAVIVSMILESTMFGQVSLSSAIASVVFLLMDVPILVVHLVMDSNPFQRLKNGYRFKKYHNTQDHNSLF